MGNMFGRGFDSRQLHKRDNSGFEKIWVVPYSLKPCLADKGRIAVVILVEDSLPEMQLPSQAFFSDNFFGNSRCGSA